MKKYSVLSIVFLTSILILGLPVTAYANSSWHWLTTSPITVLPFAIVLTLLIETISIVRFGKANNFKKVFCIVTFVNLLSFIAPYIERAYRFIPTSGGFNLLAAFDKGPYYIVLVGYLALTVIIELPVAYFLLRKYTESEKKLAISILVANVITTFSVATIERIICIGQW